MNELIFFTHLLLMIGFLFAALRFGIIGLTVLVSLQTIFANIFVVKQINLFGLSVTCSDVFMVGGLLALNLLQEFFGKESAQRAVRVSLFSAVFFVAMVEMHLFYAPNGDDRTQLAFLQIFSATPRIVFASIAVFFLVQQMDMRIFAWMQKKSNGRNLPLRVGVSLFISQTIDTVLFSFAGLYGIVASVMAVMIVSLPIKFLSIACSAPFTAVCRRFVKIYPNNLKDREFGKEAPQNFDLERATIAGRQGASENQNSEAKPTPPKTDSLGCLGIKKDAP